MRGYMGCDEGTEKKENRLHFIDVPVDFNQRRVCCLNGLELALVPESESDAGNQQYLDLWE